MDQFNYWVAPLLFTAPGKIMHGGLQNIYHEY